MKKIAIGGVTGGLILFVWSFIAHLPPVGTAGEHLLASKPLLREMSASMHERGVYVLLPNAVVAYNPHPAGFPTWILLEFLGSLLGALLGAFIATNLTGGYWRRVFSIAAIGIIAVIVVDGGYWNWFGFPTTYFLAQFVDHGIGWLLTGMALARICR